MNSYGILRCIGAHASLATHAWDIEKQEGK